jgi:hypothetical protein
MSLAEEIVFLAVILMALTLAICIYTEKDP